jgi:exopolysaccharide biosynthesis polyprenyl glycosylphosphotransferase
MLSLADVTSALLAAGALGLTEPTGGVVASVWAAALAPGWVLLAKVRGLYDTDHVRMRHQTIDELEGLFHWVTLSVALTGLVLALIDGGLIDAQGALAMWVVAFVSSFSLRAAARAIWRRIVPAERVVVIGEGQLADALVRKLALESGHHLDLVDRLELDEAATEIGTAGPDAFDVSASGVPPGSEEVALGELERYVRQHGIERVVIAVHDLDEATLSRVTSTCRSLGVKLSVAPPLRAMLGTAVELSHLAELPLIEFRTWDPSRSTMLLKRVAEVMTASFLLTFLCPVLLTIAVAVRLESPGRAVFRQRRAGRNGRPFWMLKFRTMVPDAEHRVDEVVSVEDLAEPMFKLRRDPRVTRVGRFLRRWSLDELPQLLNVLKGDMSLVGPRPEELWLVDRYQETERFRLEMRPGITGPMQVHGRGELTFQERLAVEREYVENYSLRKDMKILLRTVAAVIRGRGAF